MTEPRTKADWEKAVDQGMHICEMIDEEMPDKAWNEATEFLEDVREQCSGVVETIERSQRVSEKQQKALNNWERAVTNWMESD